MSKKKSIILIITAFIVGIIIGVLATLGVMHNSNEGSVWFGGASEPAKGGAIYSDNTTFNVDAEVDISTTGGSNGGAITGEDSSVIVDAEVDISTIPNNNGGAVTNENSSVIVDAEVDISTTRGSNGGMIYN